MARNKALCCWSDRNHCRHLDSPTRVIAQTQQYMVRELSGDDATVVPCKLNNLGDIAGRAGSAIGGKARASVWNRSNLQSKNLAAVAGGDYSSAFDINDAGEVTGASNTGSGMVPFI